MASPPFKIYRAPRRGETGYTTATHDLALASLAMELYGDGATVRVGHKLADTAWMQGYEDPDDEVTDAVERRMLAETLLAGDTEAQCDVLNALSWFLYSNSAVRVRELPYASRFPEILSDDEPVSAQSLRNFMASLEEVRRQQA